MAPTDYRAKFKLFSIPGVFAFSSSEPTGLPGEQEIHIGSTQPHGLCLCYSFEQSWNLELERPSGKSVLTPLWARHETSGVVRGKDTLNATSSPVNQPSWTYYGLHQEASRTPSQELDAQWGFPPVLMGSLVPACCLCVPLPWPEFNVLLLSFPSGTVLAVRTQWFSFKITSFYYNSKL